MDIATSGFTSVFFFPNFTFACHGFHLQNTFLNWRAVENLVVHNKDNGEFMSRNDRSDSCPLEIS